MAVLAAGVHLWGGCYLLEVHGHGAVAIASRQRLFAAANITGVTNTHLQ